MHITITVYGSENCSEVKCTSIEEAMQVVALMRSVSVIELPSWEYGVFDTAILSISPSGILGIDVLTRGMEE